MGRFLLGGYYCWAAKLTARFCFKAGIPAHSTARHAPTHPPTCSPIPPCLLACPIHAGDAHVGGVGRLYSRNPRIRNLTEDPLYMPQVSRAALLACCQWPAHGHMLAFDVSGSSLRHVN